MVAVAAMKETAGSDPFIDEAHQLAGELVVFRVLDLVRAHRAAALSL